MHDFGGFCGFFVDFFSYTIERMKTILQHAIEIEGTQRRLAQTIGLSEKAISNWVMRSKVPRKREAQLIKLYGRRKVPTWKPPT